MAYLGHGALQKALFLKLTGDATLLAMVNGIYDRPPQTAAFPYILVGDTDSRDWSTKTTKGMQCEVTLHIWSREGGRKQAADIMERVYGLLDQTSLTIENQTHVLTGFTGGDIALESDGWTYHASMRFSVLMQSN